MPSDSELGAFYVVGTPIGNLADLSARAREALAGAEAVFCEDTRVGAKLFNALGISPSPKFLRCDAHVDARAISAYVEDITRGVSKGLSYALISDAGTPGISDPGSALVKALRENGSVKILGIPGASAVATLISVSGFSGTEFGFFGFFPRDEKSQRAEIARFLRPGSVDVGIWFESPMRMLESMELLKELIPTFEMVAAKELTKLFEKHFAGSVAAVADAVVAELATVGKKGEWCFAIQRGEVRLKDDKTASVGGDEGEGIGEEAWTKALQCLKNAGVSVSESARQVSQVYGVQKRQAYDVALKLAGEKSRDR